ncbi:CYTH and CHAD domain-containing protein [Streptomyces bugieae]|uniref:CYTH and CHAD domain-containing protein n=1 Tax=Streptomyces bugieae TaxID=3098223 RepID=A0ABU7NNI4_9ACTN|nr:CYTH and CHAD domain-containing protein [Streptomyces sp. DSM 41528]
MADTVREIERKYEADDDTHLPDLAGVDRVATVEECGTDSLDALYYDTADQRLAADGVTFRRRTGGPDAGWHLKLPVEPGVREEIRAPLSDAPPPELTALVRSRTRGQDLIPLVRLRTRRTVRVLRDAAGTPLAEVAEDAVTARRVTFAAPQAAASGQATASDATGPREARWHEIEVELADAGGDATGKGGNGTGKGGTGLLDAIGRALADAGVRPASAPSKLARALTETGLRAEGAEAAAGYPAHAPSARSGGKPRTAADLVLDYAAAQVRAITALDPAVRRDLPDSVHQMRVATRRLRSAFRSYAKVLDRAVTDPIGDELKWLAGELGVGRDQEVLAERLRAGLAEVPRTLRLGPVAARLRLWSQRNRAGARDRVLAVLDDPRYLALLDRLHALLAEPPLRTAAERPASEAAARAVLKDYRRLAGRMEAALDAPAGRDRDEALHSARKAAKRTRYAAEAARPALGKPAKKFAKRIKKVQQLLGDHQDSVVARGALRDLATQAHHAGEGGFTFGLLYGREEALAAGRERDLPATWAKASRKRLRARLGA